MQNQNVKSTEKAPNKVHIHLAISDDDHVCSSISINQLTIFTFLAQ